MPPEETSGANFMPFANGFVNVMLADHLVNRRPWWDLASRSPSPTSPSSGYGYFMDRHAAVYRIVGDCDTQSFHSDCVMLAVSFPQSSCDPFAGPGQVIHPSIPSEMMT